jgi:hypothetical protein
LVETFYYALASDEPPACRLHQARAAIAGEDAPALFEAFARQLDGAYGAGYRPEGVFDYGSAWWAEVRQWASGPVEVLLYRVEDEHQEPRVGLRLRHAALKDAFVREQALDYSSRREVTPLDRLLAESIASDDPEVARELLAEDHPEWRERSKLLLRLSREVPDLSGARRAARLLAIDRLAARMLLDPELPGWEERRRELAELGITYSWNHMGRAWIYEHDLLWRVAQELPGTEWGRWAIVTLLYYGWNTSHTCAVSDTFRLVTEHGEPFLTGELETRHRLPATLSLAQAYETWFTLSRAEAGDYARAPDYTEGAEEARESAIAYYEEVLRLDAESSEADWARWSLPRLRLGVATNQRRYFCVYD